MSGHNLSFPPREEHPSTLEKNRRLDEVVGNGAYLSVIYIYIW